MHQNISTLLIILSFMNFFVDQTSIFFCKVENLNINHGGVPREHHLGEVLHGRSKYKSNILFQNTKYLISKFLAPTVMLTNSA